MLILASCGLFAVSISRNLFLMTSPCYMSINKCKLIALQIVKDMEYIKLLTDECIRMFLHMHSIAFLQIYTYHIYTLMYRGNP